VLAGEIALQRGLACSTAGGTHHAFPGYGAGFCLLNDLAVAAKHLMGETASKRKILIVDLDVHQVQSHHKMKSKLTIHIVFVLNIAVFIINYLTVHFFLNIIHVPP